MWPHYVQVEVGVKKIDIHLVCNVLWVSGSHTVGVGAVLTGGPALCGSGLLQLYQRPHHGRQGTGCLSTTGLPLGDTLLLVSGLRQRLFTLWRRRTPAEKISVNRRKSSINLGEKMIHNKKKKQKKKTYLQLAPAGEVSTEHPAPGDWFLWKLDWFVWRNGDFLPPFGWSAGGHGDFLRVTSGSALHLLGDISRSGWWKRLRTC